MPRFPTVDIRQPQAFDLVGEYVHVAGQITIGDEPGSVRILDADGNELAASDRVAGGDFGGGDFGVLLHLPANPPTETGTVELALMSGDSATVEITFGGALVANYAGFLIHTVEPGDTLSAIAERYLGNPDAWPAIATANRDSVANPDLIHPGEELRVPLDGSMAG